MEKVEDLIETVKNSLSSEDQNRYKDSLEKLNLKLNTDSSQITELIPSVSIDDYVFDCLALFHDTEFGYPDELYRGQGFDDSKESLKNKARDLKVLFCNWLKKHKTTKIVVLNELIRELITLSGIDPFTVTVFAVANHFLLERGFDKFCV